MRRQRLGLVQTPEQLRFAYVSILTAAHDLMGYGQSILDLEREVKCWLAEKEHCKIESVPGPKATAHINIFLHISLESILHWHYHVHHVHHYMPT